MAKDHHKNIGPVITGESGIFEVLTEGPPLLVRHAAEFSSERLGGLPKGTRVRVLERKPMEDGSIRARIEPVSPPPAQAQSSLRQRVAESASASGSSKHAAFAEDGSSSSHSREGKAAQMIQKLQRGHSGRLQLPETMNAIDEYKDKRQGAATVIAAMARTKSAKNMLALSKV